MNLRFLLSVMLALLVSCAAPEPDAQALAGPDRDRNGVRDDVDAAIVGAYAGETRARLTVVARHLQALLTDQTLRRPERRDALRAAAQAMFASRSCVNDADGFTVMVAGGELLERELINTPARAQAWAAVDRQLGGLSFSGAELSCGASGDLSPSGS